MSKKTTKGLWLPADLVDEFNEEVKRLAQFMPTRLEFGEVGAAALIEFLRLPDDKLKLEAIKRARNYALDRVIQKLPQNGD